MAIAVGGPLVGRTAELATLRSAAAMATRGDPVGVVIAGPAGVGKTRLATELAEELSAAGAVVATSHGVQLSGGELPYAGVAELVRGLVRTEGAAGLTRSAGRDLRALGAFDGALGTEVTPDRPAVTAALLATVEGLGRQRTVVWLVDDFQWLDAASRDLVQYLIRVVQEAHLLVLVTVRDPSAGQGDGPDPVMELARAPRVTTLRLEPLADVDIDAQARSLSSRPLGAAELERIRRLSDGLPFFVRELVSAEGSTPPTLRKAVTMTTRDLSDDTRLLLRAVALEETLSRPDLAGAVAGLDDTRLAKALAEARNSDVLHLDRDRDVLRFRHALLREAVDDEMLAGERRGLHRRWAEVLDDLAGDTAPGVLVARARHRYLVGDARAAYPDVLAAAQYVDRTEDQAAQALWWERVLECWPDDGDAGLVRDRVLYNLLLACAGIGAAQRALTLLAPELDRADPRDRLRHLWLQLTHRHLAKLAGGKGEVASAPADADGLLTWLRTRGPDFRVNAVLHFLLHEWDGSRPDLYLPICDELARRGEKEDDIEGWFLAMRHRGWWQQSRGDFEGQLQTARAARETVMRRLPARRMDAEWDWCWGLEESGRYVEAAAAAEQALGQVEEPRAALYLWSLVACCAASAYAALGDWEAARTWTARVELHTDGLDEVRVLAARIEGEIAARTGALDRAARLLEGARDATEELGSPWRALACAALGAEIALIRRDRALGGVVLGDLGDVRHAVGSPDEVAQVLLSLSRLAESAEDGLLDGASEVGERLLPPAGRVQSAVRAELVAHQHRIAGSDSGVRWEAVAGIWQELGRVYDAVWCRHLQAAAAARVGLRDEATRALSDAWQTARDLTAEPLCDRIAALARRARLPLDGVTTDSVAGLTERETQVLRLIAVGRTNAQIAQDLVMSPKTASVHVSRILSKLGAANRTEAAALARGLGLD